MHKYGKSLVHDRGKQTIYIKGKRSSKLRIPSYIFEIALPIND
jgi:hypothetical protein